MTSRAAMHGPAIAIAVVTWAGLVMLAWLSPIAGDDWNALDGWTPAARLHQLLVTSRLAHVVLSPLIVIATLAGATVLVSGRRPDGARTLDPIAFAVVAAALWIGCARLGVVFTHRPLIAHHVLSLGAALWLFVPVRTGTWKYGSGGRLACAVLLGLVAAAGPLVIAVPALTALVALTVFDPRVRSWTLPAAAGAAAGVIWAASAGTSTPAMIGGGGWIALLHQTGELVMWTSLLLAAALLVSRLRRTTLPVAPAGEIAAIGWLALLAGAALAVAAVISRRPDAAALFAPMALLVLAGARAVLLVADNLARRVLAVLAIAVHIVALLTGIAALDDAADQAAARDVALRAGRSTVPPVRPVGGAYWTVGDDLASAARRARIAALYGLDDITVEPRFRTYEPRR